MRYVVVPHAHDHIAVAETSSNSKRWLSVRYDNEDDDDDNNIICIFTSAALMQMLYRRKYR